METYSEKISHFAIKKRKVVIIITVEYKNIQGVECVNYSIFIFSQNLHLMSYSKLWKIRYLVNTIPSDFRFRISCF